MAEEAAATTIIVKRPRKGGHGHHSSAWKVALADFMTAMMAFFMLMWLLVSATPEQLNAVSAYFNDPLATAGNPDRGGGNPALDGGEGILDGKGTNPFDQQSEDDSAVSHGDDSSASSESQNDDTGGFEAIEDQMMQKMLEELRSVITESETLKEFADQLLLDMTPEGLRIQIADAESRPMFDQGAATLKPYFSDIIRELVRVVSKSDNGVSVSGHTDALQYSSDSAYTNWELSADRANAARRALVRSGLDFARVKRVVGLGDSEPLEENNPTAPINRRISIVVLRSDFDRAKRIEQSALVPDSDPGPAPAAEIYPAPTSSAAAASAPLTESPALDDASTASFAPAEAADAAPAPDTLSIPAVPTLPEVPTLPAFPDPTASEAQPEP
jgi:chemotaxis protein MotB